MATVRCWCDCHRDEMIPRIPPDVRDHVAAATACRVCLNSHSPAITSEWPIVPPPNPLLMPWVDSYPQADGTEGHE